MTWRRAPTSKSNCCPMFVSPREQKRIDAAEKQKVQDEAEKAKRAAERRRLHEEEKQRLAVWLNGKSQGARAKAAKAIAPAPAATAKPHKLSASERWSAEEARQMTNAFREELKRLQAEPMPYDTTIEPIEPLRDDDSASAVHAAAYQAAREAAQLAAHEAASEAAHEAALMVAQATAKEMGQQAAAQQEVRAQAEPGTFLCCSAAFAAGVYSDSDGPWSPLPSARRRSGWWRSSRGRSHARRSSSAAHRPSTRRRSSE